MDTNARRLSKRLQGREASQNNRVYEKNTMDRVAEKAQGK